MSTPVNKEVAWDKTKTIMSKTDAKGVIEYVNQVFMDVCGYSEAELIGKPHNVIRHPDMPKTIFKILWDNIQKGINFHAIVKNLLSVTQADRSSTTWVEEPLFLSRL